LSTLVPFAYSATFTFSNTNFVTIGTDVSPPTKAVPYPSGIGVAGLNGQVVTKVTVSLQGFSHTYPSDVDVLLVGPQGQKAILMANAGGQDRYSVTNLTLVFSDDATNTLPLFTSLMSGIFKPTNGYLDPYFGKSSLPFDLPPPAPPGNSNSPSLLSVFKNTDPGGTWNLFVVSGVSGDSGMISNGWSLNLSMSVPLQIARLQTNIVVSWPASATNCTLQVSPYLRGSNTWSNVLTAPVTNAGRLTVTNPLLGGNAFYRLVTN
jgi:subtilisin-like proprotein convertase family protein